MHTEASIPCEFWQGKQRI